MKNQIKKIKATTIENYSAQQVWTAVLLRGDSYRSECDGIYVLDSGDHYEFHCSHHDYRRAVHAIVGLGAVSGLADSNLCTYFGSWDEMD